MCCPCLSTPTALLLLALYLIPTLAYPDRHTHHHQLERSFEIDLPDVYPESADFSHSTCEVYISSTSNNTLIRYDVIGQTSYAIEIPGISNNEDYLLSGVDVDKHTGDVLVSANARAAFFTNGADLSGPSVLLRYSPQRRMFVAATNLTEYIDHLEPEFGHRVGGFQDQAEDEDGNVYYLATWGNIILKIDPQMKISTFYLPPKGTNNGTQAGFGGLFIHHNTLVVSDALSGSLVVFDLDSATIESRSVTPSNVPLEYSPLLCDSLYAPTRYHGSIALCADDFVDGVGGIVAYRSTDGWQSTEYMGILWDNVTGIEGAVMSATFQADHCLFGLVAYVPNADGVLPNATTFPIIDITGEIDKIVSAAE